MLVPKLELTPYRFWDSPIWKSIRGVHESVHMGIAFLFFFQSCTRLAFSHQKLRYQRHGAPLHNDDDKQQQRRITMTKNNNDNEQQRRQTTTTMSNNDNDEQQRRRTTTTTNNDGNKQRQRRTTTTTNNDDNDVNDKETWGGSYTTISISHGK